MQDIYSKERIKFIMDNIIWKKIDDDQRDEEVALKTSIEINPIEHMEEWRKEHKDYYKSSEIFWKEFFKEMEEIL